MSILDWPGELARLVERAEKAEAECIALRAEVALERENSAGWRREALAEEADATALGAQLAAAQADSEVWLITIEAHCTVLSDGRAGDHDELLACIRSNCDEIRAVLAARATKESK